MDNQELNLPKDLEDVTNEVVAIEYTMPTNYKTDFYEDYMSKYNAALNKDTSKGELIKIVHIFKTRNGLHK